MRQSAQHTCTPAHTTAHRASPAMAMHTFTPAMAILALCKLHARMLDRATTHSHAHARHATGTHSTLQQPCCAPGHCCALTGAHMTVGKNRSRSRLAATRRIPVPVSLLAFLKRCLHADALCYISLCRSTDADTRFVYAGPTFPPCGGRGGGLIHRLRA